MVVLPNVYMSSSQFECCICYFTLFLAILPGEILLSYPLPRIGTAISKVKLSCQCSVCIRIRHLEGYTLYIVIGDQMIPIQHTANLLLCQILYVTCYVLSNVMPCNMFYNVTWYLISRHLLCPSMLCQVTRYGMSNDR